MDLQGRLNHLEQQQDWAGLVGELEQALAGESQSAVKAAIHLRLGRLLETKFLQSAKALKHYQEAFKLNPALVEALEEARLIYLSLGKLGMVQKLLELELKSAQDAARVSRLLVELGDVLVDSGDYERATATYARALGASEGANSEARELLEDIQCDEEGWQERVAELLRRAHAADLAASKARLFVRAARIAQRFAPEAVEGMLAQAYSADVTDHVAAHLYESLMTESGRGDALAEIQRTILGTISGDEERANVAFRLAARWLTRHQNLGLGAELLGVAFAAVPSDQAIFALLRDTWGANDGDWDHLVALVDESLERTEDLTSRGFLLSQVGTLLWHKLGNLIRARHYFERLSEIEPEHPSLKAFELQIGEKLVSVSETTEVGSEEVTTSATPVENVATEVVEEVAAQEEPEALVAGTEESAPVEPAPTFEEDAERVAELREAAAKQEAAKRYNELVRTLVQLAQAVGNPAEKVDIYLRAADLYTTRFANQAEAIKAYEAILEIEPDHAQATDVLRQMYERRRDWEKLLRLQRREAESMADPAQRAAAFVQMAKLATERVKKPDVCIELWSEVLELEPEHPDAIASLAFLYERTKNYEALARILEKQAELTFEVPQKVQILSKLALLYGDRLGSDEGAVRAWRALLAIEPNDRRAQEALKKR